MIHFIGYLLAALIGLSLGLVGGGGSILTVPLLVYLFAVRPQDAMAYSMLIVGGTALVGAIEQLRRGMVDFRSAAAFALPSVAAVYLMRRVVMPSLPATLGVVGGRPISKDAMVMGLFGAIMLAASVAMIRPRKECSEGAESPTWQLLGPGFLTGLVTGSVGAGGGFLIVPALVLIANVPIKRAVGTSLLVIAINSLIGFGGDLQTGRVIPWPFVLSILAIAIIGSFLGGHIGRFVPGSRLRPAFGYLVLVIGLFTCSSQLFGRF